MKGKLYLVMLLLVLMLSACTKKPQVEQTEDAVSSTKPQAGQTEDAVSSAETEQKEEQTVSGETKENTGLDAYIEKNTYVAADFTGLKKTTHVTTGNCGENLSAAGYICDTTEGVFYADGEGIFSKQEAGTVCVHSQGAEYLNYQEGKLYFIHKGDRSIQVLSLENGETETVLGEVKAYYLCVTDHGIYYVNDKNELYVMDAEKNSTLISDKAPGWMNFYGEWLIFAESANQSHLVAVNCLTGEKKQLLSYAMFPCIAGDKLYYSGCENGRDSFIGELNLTTGENRSLGEYWSGSKVVSENRLYFISGSRVYAMDLDNPTHGEVVYSDKDEDMLSLSQGKVFFLSSGKIMYLQEGMAYEYASK